VRTGDLIKICVGSKNIHGTRDLQEWSLEPLIDGLIGLVIDSYKLDDGRTFHQIVFSDDKIWINEQFLCVVNR
jgi:hypothetical protein